MHMAALVPVSLAEWQKVITVEVEVDLLDSLTYTVPGCRTSALKQAVLALFPLRAPVL